MGTSTACVVNLNRPLGAREKDTLGLGVTASIATAVGVTEAGKAETGMITIGSESESPPGVVVGAGAGISDVFTGPLGVANGSLDVAAGFWGSGAEFSGT